MKLSRRNFIGMAGVSVAAGALATGGGKSCSFFREKGLFAFVITKR
jgi:hypothetical protein